MKKVLLLFGVINFLSFLSCGLDNEEIQNNDYPTTVDPLSADMLGSYKSEFASMNDYRICTTLNKYGFVDDDISLCLGREILRVEVSNEEQMIKTTKAALSKNKKFTGVADTTLLQIRRSVGLRGCLVCDGSEGDIVYIQWKVNFKNQEYRGIEVKDTEIVTFLDTAGVFRIGGNWYPEIFIPEQNKISMENAKDDLIGMEITWYDWGGLEIFIVTEESLVDTAKIMVIPQMRNDSIELRVTWEILVELFEGLPSWAIYVDTTTGETIRIDQLFET